MDLMLNWILHLEIMHHYDGHEFVLEFKVIIISVFMDAKFNISGDFIIGIFNQNKVNQH